MLTMMMMMYYRKRRIRVDETMTDPCGWDAIYLRQIYSAQRRLTEEEG